MKIIPAFTGPMSGKLGGLVASRNRGGQYFRRKAVPVNPDTALQSGVRANFATLISGWNNTLTPAQRASWTAWAANTPRIDSLGQTTVLTGQNAFVGSNTLRLQAGLQVVLQNVGEFNRGESPVVESLDSPLPATWNLGLSYGMGPSADGDVLVYVGRPQNESREFYKGPWRLTEVEDLPAAVGSLQVSLGAPGTWAYPAAVGKWVPFRVVTVYDDGRYTDGFTAFFVVPPEGT